MKTAVRKAASRDAGDIFKLSNSPTVRENSFTPEQITYKDHLKWFDEKINDRNCIFLLAVDEKNKAIGQIRLDIIDTNALLSISVDDGRSNTGIGSKLIYSAIKELETREDVENIDAYIKADNEVSINFFKKNGFKFNSKCEIKAQQAYIYRLPLKK